jgi:hypothetical protein
MDKVEKHNSFNTNTPSSESYRNYSYPVGTAGSPRYVVIHLHSPNTSSWRLTSTAPFTLVIMQYRRVYSDVEMDGNAETFCCFSLSL